MSAVITGAWHINAKETDPETLENVCLQGEAHQSLLYTRMSVNDKTTGHACKNRSEIMLQFTCRDWKNGSCLVCINYIKNKVETNITSIFCRTAELVRQIFNSFWHLYPSHAKDLTRPQPHSYRRSSIVVLKTWDELLNLWDRLALMSERTNEE